MYHMCIPGIIHGGVYDINAFIYEERLVRAHYLGKNAVKCEDVWICL